MLDAQVRERAGQRRPGCPRPLALTRGVEDPPDGFPRPSARGHRRWAMLSVLRRDFRRTHNEPLLLPSTERYTPERPMESTSNLPTGSRRDDIGRSGRTLILRTPLGAGISSIELGVRYLPLMEHQELPAHPWRELAGAEEVPFRHGQFARVVDAVGDHLVDLERRCPACRHPAEAAASGCGTGWSHSAPRSRTRSVPLATGTRTTAGRRVPGPRSERSPGGQAGHPRSRSRAAPSPARRWSPS